MNEKKPWWMNTPRHPCDFEIRCKQYELKLELLQKFQQVMRDPERTIVCDILANGSLLNDPYGMRYGACSKKIAKLKAQKGGSVSENKRVCRTCKHERDICKFGKTHKLKSREWGIRKVCKLCMNELHRRWNKKHPEARYNSYWSNPEKAKAEAKVWRDTHSEHAKRTHKQYYTDHMEEIIVKSRNWAILNPDKKKVIAQRYNRKMRATSMTRINDRITGLLNYALKHNKNGGKWEKQVGYSLSDLKRNFEAKYYNGMSWESFALGGITVHHIKPKTSFKFDSVDDAGFKECWALSNLRPLWRKDHANIHKLSRGKKCLISS